MFECNIDLVEKILEKEFGDEAEFFYDIHCSDPSEAKLEYTVHVVAVHSTGLYLVLLLEGSEGDLYKNSERLEYICRVFKSYFFTKIPIRSVFLFQKSRRSNICKKLGIYDCVKNELSFDNISCSEDICVYVEAHLQRDAPQPEEDKAELIFRLAKENVIVSDYDSEAAGCFIKRGANWVPAFKKDSDRVFSLALFGGIFGIHRFYLGLYGSGLLYFFTLGIFGTGWLFDCVEILLGWWKPKGMYLLPLKNKRKQAIKFFVILIILFCLIYISMAWAMQIYST